LSKYCIASLARSYRYRISDNFKNVKKGLKDGFTFLRWTKDSWSLSWLRYINPSLKFAASFYWPCFR